MAVAEVVILITAKNFFIVDFVVPIINVIKMADLWEIPLEIGDRQS